MKRRKGFTLIELLIVVAIIAILAAIAVPNFLEAQVRSKVSRAKSDMRSIVTALESYSVDNVRYPYTGGALIEMRYEALTTPVAYITGIPPDPFARETTPNTPGQKLKYATFDFITKDSIISWTWVGGDKSVADLWWASLLVGAMVPSPETKVYYLASIGPDRTVGLEAGTGHPLAEPYDPTNGTISWGDIQRFGP
jgi:type II secretion system protein G